ncbi:MAG: hypothetical protein GY835_03640 [bacterium]|nr:hypothetical protein [bacterium]
MYETWQRRRGALNHDWLKNDYLKAVDAFLARLEQKSPDPERLEEFLSVDLPGWDRQRPNLESLLDAAEECLSPRRLFDVPPLSNAAPETLVWLPALTHALWLARHPIQQRIAEAHAALQKAEATYKRISQELSCNDRKVGIEPLQASRSAFVDFSGALRALSCAISALPQKILVV